MSRVVQQCQESSSLMEVDSNAPESLNVPHPCDVPSNHHQSVRCSRLTASLQQKAGCATRSCGHETQELQAILQNSSFVGSPTKSFLGVSPPLRSGWAGGAANPISHDKTWTRSAYSASHTNLQALREIESSGISFLRGMDHNHILLGSPDFTSHCLSEEISWTNSCQLEPNHGAASCNTASPFHCHVEYFAV